MEARLCGLHLLVLGWLFAFELVSKDVFDESRLHCHPLRVCSISNIHFALHCSKAERVSEAVDHHLFH